MSQSLPLPPDTSLRQLRNQAKDLCRACRDGNPDAIERIAQTHPNFTGLSQAEIAAASIVLADAQLVIARELGFDSWPKLKKHVESLSRPAANMHELVAGNDVAGAMQQAVARDSESVNQLDESGLPPLYTAALYRNPAGDRLSAGASELEIDIFRQRISGKGDRRRHSAEEKSRVGTSHHSGRQVRFTLCSDGGSFRRCQGSVGQSSFRVEQRFKGFRRPSRERLSCSEPVSRRAPGTGCAG